MLQALLVTFLWSTSWVLIKLGLDEIPALTFAGLRYVLAFLCLLPVVAWRREVRRSLTGLGARDWGLLLLLGLLMYTATQGAQFLGLALLPAVTVSLLLAFTPVIVAVLGIPLLGERPSSRQWLGVGVYLAGVVVYLLPASLPPAAVLGLVVVGVGVTANAGAAVVGRAVNRRGHLHPLAVTVVSMGAGSTVLLVAGVATQGLPRLSVSAWAIVGWLAVVNTAFAFTLWNHTLRRLPAMESSLINNTMLIQIAVMAWLVLGERLGPRQVIGLTLAAAGVLLVQVRGRLRRAAQS